MQTLEKAGVGSWRKSAEEKILEVPQKLFSIW